MFKKQGNNQIKGKAKTAILCPKPAKSLVKTNGKFKTNRNSLKIELFGYANAFHY